MPNKDNKHQHRIHTVDSTDLQITYVCSCGAHRISYLTPHGSVSTIWLLPKAKPLIEP